MPATGSAWGHVQILRNSVALGRWGLTKAISETQLPNPEGQLRSPQSVCPPHVLPERLFNSFLLS